MRITPEYACKDCCGDGENVCIECGSELTCAVCDGDGLDPDKIDLPRYREAVKTNFARNPHWAIVETIQGQGEYRRSYFIGRQNDTVQIFYKDFVKGETNADK